MTVKYAAGQRWRIWGNGGGELTIKVEEVVRTNLRRGIYHMDIKWDLGWPHTTFRAPSVKYIDFGRVQASFTSPIPHTPAMRTQFHVVPLEERATSPRAFTTDLKSKAARLPWPHVANHMPPIAGLTHGAPGSQPHGPPPFLLPPSL